MGGRSINDALKEKERLAAHKTNGESADGGGRALSPMRLVFRRFVQSRLAIVGAGILFAMFIFSFLGPVFYPYGQAETMYKYGMLENVPYAQASKQNGYARYMLAEYDISVTLDALIKSRLGGLEQATVSENGVLIELKRLDAHTYTASPVGDSPVAVYSSYTVDAADGTAASNGFKAKAFFALGGNAEEKNFSFDGNNYRIITAGDGAKKIVNTNTGKTLGYITNLAVKRIDGSNSLSLPFKNEIAAVIADMDAAGAHERSVICQNIEKQAKDTSIVKGENGETVYEPTEIKVSLEQNVYMITCSRLKYLIDKNARPCSKDSESFHLLGTDGDGYDLLARMMYGGRVSLLVGFIVVIIETVIGVIMGGIAGYFGGFADAFIMRLVDVFYCIPSLPLLIILGAFFDKSGMPPYIRLAWMMALLGFLGWAGIARLVRGQILLLREQEFMVAAEVAGISTRRRIFKHLIPNVMPQLIVSATMGLGSVILTESTLSFLGLGVKRPLATWGTMINSVSDYSGMVSQAYIWIPVGVLICLTVIAFNFVGDGLRDAFDPKMRI